MENQNEATCVVLSREELFDLYGSWFGNTATPADMVCWCDRQIEKYEEWIKNCKELKLENQKKLLKDIPVGTLVHNVELNPKRGGQMARSAGAYAQLMAKEGEYALLRLPSGELRKVKSDCRATIGQVGKIEHELENIGKAGKNRHRGIRPTVRGVVMNPVDHPHGGGEGRTSGGRHPVTPWGLQTRGLKTRKNKRTNQFIVKRRK